MGQGQTYLLLELLVDGITSILDGDAFHVAGSNLKAKWEMKVDPFDGWRGEHLLQDFLVFYRRW